MNSLRQWISAKPFTAVSLAALFGAVPSIFAFREDWIVPLLLLFAAGLVIFAFSAWSYSRYLVLACLLTFSRPAKAEEPQQVGPVAAGIVVVCVGGYCVYKLVKICQKVFPKDDPKTNETSVVSFHPDDEYGASWTFNSYTYCSMQKSLVEEQDPTTFTLDVLLSAGQVRTSMAAVIGQAIAQSFEDFQAEVATHGLVISDHADPSPHFERNRVPCDSDYVPLIIDPTTKTVSQSNGGPLQQLTIERSTDLISWVPFLNTQIGDGTGFRVVDTTREGQMFYRVTVGPTIP